MITAGHTWVEKIAIVLTIVAAWLCMGQTMMIRPKADFWAILIVAICLLLILCMAFLGLGLIHG